MPWDMKAQHRKRSCEGKVRYATEALARAGAQDMLKRTGRRRGGVYPCEFCGLWHVSSEGKGRYVVVQENC
ncbi:hypothetical protein CcrBL47_gp403 [Caulobacter phage BL47]|nr:hypothetical protein CcrBL47_gp403 [Caulobacter phage BL47]